MIKNKNNIYICMLYIYILSFNILYINTYIYSTEPSNGLKNGTTNLIKNKSYQNISVSMNNIRISKNLLSNAQIEYDKGNNKKSLNLANKALEVNPTLYDVFNHKALIYIRYAQYDIALNNLNLFLRISNEKSNNINIIQGNINMAFLEKSRFNYSKALRYIMLALKYNDKVKNPGYNAYCYGMQGLIYSKQGNYTLAYKSYTKALEIYKKMNCKNGLAYIYNNLGLYYLSQDKYNKTKDLINKSLKINREEQYLEGIISNYNNLAYISNLIGNIDVSIELYNKSLKMLNELGDNIKYHRNKLNIASLYIKNGQPTKSEKIIEESKEYLTENGSVGDLVKLKYTQGELEFNNKNYKKAKQYFQQGLDYSQNIGKINDIINGQLNIANILLKENNKKDALNILNKIKSNLRNDSNSRVHGYVYNSLGIIKYKYGNYDEALKYYNRALKIFKELNLIPDVASIYNNIALLMQKINKLDSAENNLLKAIAIDEKLNLIPSLITDYINIAFLNISKKNLKKAKFYNLKATNILKKLGLKSHIALLSYQSGKINYSANEINETLKEYNNSLVLFKNSKDIYSTAIIYNNMGLLYINQKNNSKATEFFVQSIKLFKSLNNDQLYSKELNLVYLNLLVVYSKNKNELEVEEIVNNMIALNKNNKHKLLEIYSNIAEVFILELNKYKKGVELYLNAFNIDKEINKDHKDINMYYNNLVNILEKSDNKDKITNVLKFSINVYEYNKMYKNMYYACIRMIKILLSKKKLKEAIIYKNKVQDISHIIKRNEKFIYKKFNKITNIKN